ncbi:MAG: hypothetical protein JXB29_10075 [Sedimentisphaerales bacterium]|nr:hypothetical protein [Sedimentisphaerales bacterium]
MNCMTILAQAVDPATEPPVPAEETIVPIDEIWEHITSLNLIEALTFISFGVVCIFYGWRVFKVLVIISFAFLGLILGITIAGKVGGENREFFGALVGVVALGVLAVPLMRWAVSILGAIAGGLITSGIWYACGLNESYIWAGAITGIVAGGMISFIIFKIAVMLFSSLGGSVLMVVGTLALLYLYPATTEDVEQLFFNHKWFLPIALIVPTAIGILVQNKFIKGSKNWNI